MIYEDIFEAIRSFMPQDQILHLKDNAGKGQLVRRLAFDAIDTGEGDIVLLPRTGLNVMFYRGQGDASWSTVPSMFRNATPESILVDRIKLLDFAMVAEKFPQVKRAKSQGVRVDTLALAQHYGLRTNMLDLTSDIAVAAFFATTELRDKAFHPIEEGIGSISGIFIMIGMETENTFHPVGLQPFLRPGKQCAFGLRLKEGQCLEELQCSWTLKFHQKAVCGQAFLNLFGSTIPNELFPQERIARIGEHIRNGSYVTQAAVDAYCEQMESSQDEIRKQLDKQNVKISKKPVFNPTPKELGHEKIHVIQNGAFGNEIILSRLMCLPGGDNDEA